MIEVLTTREFDHWLRRLKDKQGRLRILARLDRLTTGNFGDAKSVGGGVVELRFSFGPGYRIYAARRGTQLVLLLCGGDKSTQRNDITKAHHMAREWNSEEEQHG